MLLFVALMLLATACGVRGSSWAGVAASENGEIYVSYQRFIAKLDANGERIWTYPADDDRDELAAIRARIARSGRALEAKLTRSSSVGR